MAKQKTPQELYRERKEKEEAEKAVCLPPGLVNHGNTCFMNSVLQGLIATRYLHNLFECFPLPSVVHDAALGPIASRRSPLLTNGHGLGGKYEKDWEAGMPIGDIFVSIMQRAWLIQQKQRRENMSPRDLLSAVGQKYDQYLDFRQQDAHEFLRQLLDAIRMEELDIIKKRQPPPPKPKKLRRRSTVRALTSMPPSPSPLAAVMNHSLTQPTEQLDPEEKLISFTDMLFGGKLTSILVCQKCKHISHTYEDFNDLSLSIKPEDYARERKRDRLKTLAKKFKNLHGSALGVGPSGIETHRSSSVPASPRKSAEGGILDEVPLQEPRRRSLDHVEVDKGLDTPEADTNPNESYVAVSVDETVNGAEVESDPKSDRIEFLEPLKVEKKNKKGKDDDGWAKLGRRISMTVGMSKDKEREKETRRSRSVDKARSRRSVDMKRKDDEEVESSTYPISSSQRQASDLESKAPELRLESNKLRDESSASSPAPAISPPLSSAARFSLIARSSSPSISGVTRSKSPRPPKATPQEAAYLRQILADITPTSANPFGIFKSSPNGSANNAASLLMKMGQLPGVEECLRMFTAVEVLDGENMVGCRRCWKIANGVYRPKSRPHNGCDDSDSEESEKSDDDSRPEARPEEDIDATVEISSPPSSPSASASMTSSLASLDGRSDLATDTPQSSLSNEVTLPSPPSTVKPPPPALPLLPPSTSPSPEPHPTMYGGMPIPVISTTAPESPLSPPTTARPAPVPRNPSFANHSGLAAVLAAPLSIQDSLRAPRATRHKRMQGDADSTTESADESSDETLESDTSASVSILSDASSIPSPGISPNASPTISQEQLSRPVTDPPTPKPSPTRPKIPRSKQVIMRPAYKRYLISTPPPVLVIHLKRFQQTSKAPVMSFSSGLKKLDDFVAFPEYLDIAPFLAPKREDFGLGIDGKPKPPPKKPIRCMYRLYAVVVHIGNMLGGHYIAYTAVPSVENGEHPQAPEIVNSAVPTSKPEVTQPPASGKTNKDERKWAYISDTVVRLVTLDEVLKAKAYICMYERI